MRPEKLGFEDCELDAIFKTITKKNTQKPDSESNKNSKSANKSNKLPLPKDFKPNTGKAYQNSKTNDPKQSNFKQFKSCGDSDTSSISSAKKEQSSKSNSSWATKEFNHNSKTEDDHSSAHSKHSSITKRNCDKSDLCRKSSCKSICKNKCPQGNCYKYTNNPKSSKSSIQLGHKKDNSESQKDICNNPKSNLKTKFAETSWYKYYFLKEVHKYLQAKETRKSSSASSQSDNLKSKSSKDNCKKRHKLERECESRDKRGKNSRSCTNDSCKERKSCSPSCKRSCHPKSVKNECEKHLNRTKKHPEEENSCSNSSLSKSCPRKPQLFGGVCKEICYIQNKNRDICQNYQKQKCEKYKQNKVSTKHPEDNSLSHSSFSSCRSKSKTSYSDSSNIHRKSERHFNKNHPEIHSGEKSSSYSSICTKSESSGCKIFSDKQFKIKFGQYIAKKYFTKHSEKSAKPSEKSSIDARETDIYTHKKCTKTQKEEKSMSHLNNHKNKKSSKDLAACTFTKESPRALPKKALHKDFCRESLSNKCTDVCKVTENCEQRKSHLKDIIIGPNNKASCNKDLCRKRSEYLKLSSEGLYYSPINSSIYCESDIETSTTQSENKSNLESIVKSNPSQLCNYLCSYKSDKIRATYENYSQISEQKKNPHSSKEVSRPAPIVQNLDKREENNISGKIYILTTLVTNKSEKQNIDTTTTEVIKNNNEMDSGTTNKVCFTNPRNLKQSIDTSINSTNINTVLEDSKSNKTDSLASNQLNVNDSKNISTSELPINANNKGNDKEYLICDYALTKGRYVPVGLFSQNSSSESPKVKSLVDAHCETMTNIKCAMQDIVCKAYKTTSQAAVAAATLIHNQSTKQIEKIKQYRSRQEDSVIKLKAMFCNDKTDGKKIPQQLDNEMNGDTPLPSKILKEIVAKVDSVLSIISDTVSYDSMSRNLPSFNFNDQSSKYDIPSTKLDKKKPKSIENLFESNTTSTTNSMFMAIKTKIMSMFTGVSIKSDETSSEDSVSLASSTSLTNIDEAATSK